MWIASADDQLQIGDKVTVFSRPEDMKPVKHFLRRRPVAVGGIVIVGGGETGLHLARTLEREGFKVMIIEQDADRCTLLANLLETTSVIHATATDPENLEEQRVGYTDVFVACTGDDEDNLMLGVKAKDLGAKQVMSVIGRPDYASVTARLGINLAVSSRDVMAKQIISYLHEGVVISRTKLPGGLINVIEVDVLAGSRATEANLAELELPDRCLIVAIIHLDYVRVPGAADRLKRKRHRDPDRRRRRPPGGTGLVLAVGKRPSKAACNSVEQLSSIVHLPRIPKQLRTTVLH